MTERSDTEPGPADPQASREARSLDGADLARRRFFRQFAGEVVHSAATMTGAAGLLQRSLSEAAWATLDPAATTGDDSAPNGAAASAPPLHDAFRLDGDRVMLIDQRQLPDALVEFPVATASDGVRAIREAVIRGTPATSHIAALCLAMTAQGVTDMRAAYARQATLRFSADALISAHPSAAAVRWAVGRCLARAADVGATGEDGWPVAEAIRTEAFRIAEEAARDHARLATFGFDAMPIPSGRPLNLLTHSSTGWLAGGQVGTALGIVDVAISRGQPVHVFVAETRPDLEGTRLAAWELGRADVPHTVVTDAAAGWLLATRGEIDAVIVGAETIAANGDTVSRVGTYPLAALAVRHDVPFFVCAPLCSVDLETTDGAGIPIEQRAAEQVMSIRGMAAAAPASTALNPASDMTPATLITGIVTEEGVLRPDYVATLAAAVAAREARWGEPELRSRETPSGPPSLPAATPVDP
jgi:methylthioribose-1-phosphate isomerase